MVYMKYVLSKTGWFPKWERGVEDILDAASMVYDVKNIVTPHENYYYYVMPNNYSIRHLHGMLRLFRANGIFLRPHKSREYSGLVFRVPNHGQQFMQDVMRVTQDANNIYKVLSEHGLDMSLSEPKLAERIKNLQDRQY